MFKRHAIAIAVGSVALFSGCASTAPTAGFGIEPVLAVRGGVDAEAQYRIGRYYQGQRRLDAAEKAFLKALALDPYHAETHNALATVYFELGRIQKAEEAFKVAISLAPTRAHLHNNLGYLYQEIGRTDEAVSAYSEAFRLDPKNLRILNNLAALTCEDKGDCVAAGSGAIAALPVESAFPAAPAPVSAVASYAPAPAADALPTVAPASGAPSSASSVAHSGAPMVPTVQLASVAPNVWELRPVAAKVAQASSAPVIPVATLPQPQVKAATVQPAGTSTGRVEVANGNGVHGMAKRVGGYLREQGYAAPRLTNHHTFAQKRTEIQYVAGSEGLARQIEHFFGQPAKLVKVVSLERQAPVRVVLGKDFNESTVIAGSKKSAGAMVALGQQLELSK